MSTPAECKCSDLIAAEVKSLKMNVDAKYLTSSDFVNAEKCGRARCPVHGSYRRRSTVNVAPSEDTE
jgi:hypothetical protein